MTKRQAKSRNRGILLDQPPETDWKILFISVFLCLLLSQALKKRPLGSYEKDFLALVGALSEEEDEWDKVSIALALTPDRGTVLHCQELFYWYFSLGGKKKPSQSLILLLFCFFFKTSPQWGLQYLIQKGTLKEGYPLTSKSCFVTLRNWFHDIEAIA